MQSSSLFTGTSWKDLGEVSGLLLAGVAFLVRWVVAPATRTYVRDDLTKELEQVKEIPVLKQRVDRLEKIAEGFAGVPESLARIEGYIKGREE